MFDSERMKVMSPTSHLPDAQYFNDPSEFNAFTQEAIAKFEEVWRRLSTGAKINMERQWQSFDRWYQMMQSMIDMDFKKNLNDRNERALKRRLYKYWDETIRNL